MSRLNNVSWLATLALVTLLVAPWITKPAGATQTPFKVTLGLGDWLGAPLGVPIISSNGDCGTGTWPQLHALWDPPGCFNSVLGLGRAGMPVNQRAGEVRSVQFYMNLGNINGDLYQTDRIPVVSADTPTTSACFTIHVHQARQVYKSENPGKGTPLGNIAVGDVTYCP